MTGNLVDLCLEEYDNKSLSSSDEEEDILAQRLRTLCFGLSPIVLSLKTLFFCSIFLKLNPLINQVKTEMVVVEGVEKGPTIVKEAKERGASLLVLSQKKQHATWRLLMIWASQARPINITDVVEYCINNSPCMAIAVRKRGKKLGGYTLTTKRHKDFWLLA